MQLKAIALKVRGKFYAEPSRESAAWARKHEPDLAAPLPGLAPQALPRTMPSLDFRLVWHTGWCLYSALHAATRSHEHLVTNVMQTKAAHTPAACPEEKLLAIWTHA